MVSVMRLLWLILSVSCAVAELAQEDNSIYKAEPTTALVLALAGTTIGSTFMNVQAQRQSASTASAMAKANAQNAFREAQEMEQVAQSQARQNAREASYAYSAARAGLAESGFSLKGSPNKLLADLEEQLSINATNTYRDAISRALSKQFEGSIYRAQSRAIRSALPYQIGGTILGGISDAGFKAYMLSKG